MTPEIPTSFVVCVSVLSGLFALMSALYVIADTNRRIAEAELRRLRGERKTLDNLIRDIDHMDGGAEHLAAVECLCDRIARGEKV